MDDVKRLAARFAALGHEARLQIVRQLLAHHPDGRVVGEMQRSLGIPGSTLSHHLEALHHERLITKDREGRFLRYRADGEVLRGLLDFLYAECCQAGPDGAGDGGLVTLALPANVPAGADAADRQSEAAAAPDERSPEEGAPGERAPDGETAWRTW